MLGQSDLLAVHWLSLSKHAQIQRIAMVSPVLIQLFDYCSFWSSFLRPSVFRQRILNLWLQRNTGSTTQIIRYLESWLYSWIFTNFKLLSHTFSVYDYSIIHEVALHTHGHPSRCSTVFATAADNLLTDSADDRLLHIWKHQNSQQ